MSDFVSIITPTDPILSVLLINHTTLEMSIHSSHHPLLIDYLKHYMLNMLFIAKDLNILAIVPKTQRLQLHLVMLNFNFSIIVLRMVIAVGYI